MQKTQQQIRRDAQVRDLTAMQVPPEFHDIWITCKEKTGRYPREWVKRFDLCEDVNGTVAWIDAIHAIEGVVGKYEEHIARLKL